MSVNLNDSLISTFSQCYLLLLLCCFVFVARTVRPLDAALWYGSSRQGAVRTAGLNYAKGYSIPHNIKQKAIKLWGVAGCHWVGGETLHSQWAAGWQAAVLLAGCQLPGVSNCIVAIYIYINYRMAFLLPFYSFYLVTGFYLNLSSILFPVLSSSHLLGKWVKGCVMFIGLPG